MPESKDTSIPSLAELESLGNTILKTEQYEELLKLGATFAEQGDEILASTFVWTAESLVQFKALHKQVTSKVEEALEQTKQALRDNRKRGKGIKKYAVNEINDVFARQNSLLNKKRM